LAVGVLVSAGVYVLLTAAYLRVLPAAAVAASSRVRGEVASRVFGAGGAGILTITILISIIGSTNGTVLTAARLYFAQAVDGLFFARFATVHPKFKTPSFSIAMQGVWASLLALTGSYELVATYAVFCAWFFYLMVAVGLVILRRQAPSIPRPYRMFGYPVTPIAFAGVTVWFLINNIAGNPLPSLTGMAILLAGVPVYMIWGKRTEVPRISTATQYES
jgi:APA family basic amino acid/polyamine antiporter